MKKANKIKNILLFLIVIGACTLVSCSFKNNKQEPINKDDAVFTMAQIQGNKWGAEAARIDNNLTVDKMLSYAIQDEYLQRARYEYVEKKFKEVKNLLPMVKDENIHVYRVLLLLSKYSVTIPSDKSNEFFFKFPKSADEARELLIKSESDSLAMYERFLKVEQLPEDVKSIFTKQMKDSKRHLDNFKESIKID